MVPKDEGLRILSLTYQTFAGAGSGPEGALVATVGLFGLRAAALAEDYLYSLGVEGVQDAAAEWKRLMGHQGLTAEHLNDALHDLALGADQSALFQQPIEETLPDDVVKRCLVQMDEFDLPVKTQKDLASLNWSLDRFIDYAGRRKGMPDITSPQAFNNLVARLALARKQGPITSAYDPACGVGGTLIALHEALQKRGGGSAVRYQGVDTNPVAVMTAAWRLYLRGVMTFKFEVNDVLSPSEVEGRRDRETFDIVCTVPPFYPTTRAPAISNETLFQTPNPGGRRADYLFVQHVVNTIAPGGRAVITIALTALNRSGQYETARMNLIRWYKIESVISLYDTAVPRVGTVPALLVFDTAYPSPRDALFFLAVSGDRAVPARSSPLDSDAVESILTTYAQFRDQPGSSALVDLDTVKAQNYRLVPDVYVTPEAVSKRERHVPKAQVVALEKEFAGAGEALDNALKRVKDTT